jgi:phosphoglycerate dehydrogenase-like enzyme
VIDQRPLIVALGGIHPAAEAVLEHHCRIETAPPLKPDDNPQYLNRATGLIVRGDSTVTARHIAKARSLRVIARSGTGVDNVDLEAARAAGIPIVYAPGMNVEAVAEFTVGMFIVLGRYATDRSARLREGDWRSRNLPAGREVNGSSVGIVGLGRIGAAVAERCVALGADVAAFDPYADARAPQGISRTGLDELLETCDFVSLHAPLTPETSGMLDRARIRRIRRGAVLVNAARGGLLRDLDEVLAALERDQLAGVALDVFATEPPDTRHPIFSHPRCIATPHIAGISSQSIERIFRSVALDILAVLNDREPEFMVTQNQ